MTKLLEISALFANFGAQLIYHSMYYRMGEAQLHQESWIPRHLVHRDVDEVDTASFRISESNIVPQVH